MKYLLIMLLVLVFGGCATTSQYTEYVDVNGYTIRVCVDPGEQLLTSQQRQQIIDIVKEDVRVHYSKTQEQYKRVWN